MLPSLPLPDDADVERFRQLFLDEKGVLLDELQARELATRLVQYVFLTHSALPYLRERKAEIERGAEANEV